MEGENTVYGLHRRKADSGSISIILFIILQKPFADRAEALRGIVFKKLP
jgi:hypothetical protein